MNHCLTHSQAFQLDLCGMPGCSCAHGVAVKTYFLCAADHCLLAALCCLFQSCGLPWNGKLSNCLILV